MKHCPQCNSPNWDYANVGVPHAILCTDCGDIYNGKGKKEMKKFKVIASYVTFCELEIEAENEDEAWELAKEADGGDFEPMRGRWGELSDWHIDDVSEIKE